MPWYSWIPVFVLLAIPVVASAAGNQAPLPADGGPARPPGAVASRVPIGDGAVLGSPLAPVTLVEFSDFRCPFCRLHFSQAFSEIRREYVDAGLVRYIYRDSLPGVQARGSTQTAEAARCAGEQGRFWEMHRALFTSRQAAGANELKRLARKLPIDLAEFDACLADRTYAKAVRSDIEEAGRMGVVGTPTFFIGRSGSDGAIDAVRLVGARPFAEFRRLIDPLLPSMP